MPLNLNLSITVPNQSVVDDFVTALGWTATIPDPQNPNGPEIPNPLTKADFAKKAVIKFIRQVLKQKRVADAAEAATLAQSNAVDQLEIT